MWNDLKEIFGRSARYALFCPILFLIPVAVEMIQHAIEIRGGMYVDTDGLRAAGEDPLRLAMGHLKVVALFLVGYWAARFLVFGDDPAVARRIDPRAVRLFVPVMAWGLFWLVVIQDGPLLAGAAGMPSSASTIALLSVMVASLFFEPLLCAWKVSAAAANPAIGFIGSVRLTRPVYFRALALSLIAMLPLMVAHYALAYFAVGQAHGIVWGLMAIDSLLVGYMAVTMIATAYVVARRVAERAGIDLTAAGSGAIRAQEVAA